MKKLTKQHIKQRNELTGLLSTSFQDLQEATENYPKSKDWAKVEEAIKEHNQNIQDANSFMGEVASEIEDYISNRSEAWAGRRKGGCLQLLEGSMGGNVRGDRTKPSQLRCPD